MECAICCCEVDKWLKCVDLFCTAIICVDCIKDYLHHTKRESLLPTCVGRRCEAIYRYSNIRYLGPEVVEEYITSCYNALLLKHQGTIDNQLRSKQILENIRKEKTKYIYNTFPIAVALVAEIVFKSRLNKPNIKLEQHKKYGRICMNLFCSGILDDNLICNLCNGEFCKKCEQLLTENHKCKSEEIESIKMARSLPKCPTCGANVDKDDGCIHVRCGICGTKFHYDTGKLGGGGGHTQMVPVKDKVSIIAAYGNVLHQDQELLKYISLIEGLEIKTPSYETVVTTLKNIITGKTTNKVKLMKVLERYYDTKYEWKRYIRYLEEIAKLINNGTLTIHVLKYVYDQYIVHQPPVY